MTINELYNMMMAKPSEGGAGYIAVNEALIKNLGALEAMVYCKLINYAKYYSDQSKLTKDGSFYCTIATLEDSLGIGAKGQRRILKKLEEMNLIEVSEQGMFKSRHIKVLRNSEAEEAFSKPEIKPRQKIPFDPQKMEKYSKPFNMAVLQNQVKKAVTELNLDERWVEDGLKLYEIYFREVGNPPSYYSQDSVKKLIQRVNDLDLSYGIRDFFDSYCEGYREVPCKEGYTKSINNLVTEEMLEPLAKRKDLPVEAALPF